MIRVPEDCNIRDLPRWVSEIFLYGEGDTKTPYQFLGIAPDGRVEAVPVDSPTAPVQRLRPTDCFAHWPNLGNFNVAVAAGNTPYAVHISRRTVRQWERTLSRSMLTVKKLDLFPGRPLLDTHMYITVPYTYAPFVRPEEAYGLLMKGAAESVAINRRVAIGRGLCTYKAAVFVDGELAGTLEEGIVTANSETDAPLLGKAFGGSYVIRTA